MFWKLKYFSSYDIRTKVKLRSHSKSSPALTSNCSHSQRFSASMSSILIYVFLPNNTSGFSAHCLLWHFLLITDPTTLFCLWRWQSRVFSFDSASLEVMAGHLHRGHGELFSGHLSKRQYMCSTLKSHSGFIIAFKSSSSSSVSKNSSSKRESPNPYSCAWTDTSFDIRWGEPSMKSANLWITGRISATRLKT